MGERESRSIRSWEEKNFLIPLGFKPRSAEPIAKYYIDYVGFVQSGSHRDFIMAQVKSSLFCDTAQRRWVFVGRSFGPDIDLIFKGGETKVSLEDWGKPRR